MRILILAAGAIAIAAAPPAFAKPGNIVNTKGETEDEDDEDDEDDEEDED